MLGIEATSLLLFLAVLCYVVYVDLKEQILLDVPIAFLMFLGAVRAFWGTTVSPDVVSSAIGCAVAGGIFASIRVVVNRVKPVEAMGLGDVKLAAVAGVWTGWQGVSTAFLLATVGILVTGIVLMFRRQAKTDTVLPVGPFVAIPAAVVVAADTAGLMMEQIWPYRVCLYCLPGSF